MSTSKKEVEFFMRKLKWLDALSVAVGKDHFTAHVAMVIGYHMNSDTGETFVGRETIADHIGGHVRTVEHSIQSLERLGFLFVQRARGRGHANTYVMVFPEKAASTPPLEQENAASTPPLTSVSGRNQIEEKAASDELKGGEDAHKRRHPDRSNLKESNLKELTLGNLEVEKNGRAAAPAQLSSHSPVAASTLRMSSANPPRTFANRGQYEQVLAGMLTRLGVDGWEALGSLEDHKVVALCRRLRNKTLTQAEIAEVATYYRKTFQRRIIRIERVEVSDGGQAVIGNVKATSPARDG
jgi:hypothetical protein